MHLHACARPSPAVPIQPPPPPSPPPPQVTNTNGLQWVGEALAALPEEAATSADKQRYMNAAQVGAARVGDVVAGQLDT